MRRLRERVPRAQCRVVLGCAPCLLGVDCATLEQVRPANAVCRYVELAAAALVASGRQAYDLFTVS